MTATSAFRHDKKKLRKCLHKWFGANRGTHWSVAGAVAVLIFASYLIYNNRDGGPATATTIAAAGQVAAPTTPRPLTSKK
jgi:hypothetical protein